MSNVVYEMRQSKTDVDINIKNRRANDLSKKDFGFTDN